MSNIVAGIGRGQMQVLDSHIQQRRANNFFYRDLFKNTNGIQVFVEPTEDFFSNHWLTAIVVDKTKVGFTREDLRLAFEKQNIESRPLWKPMHLQPVFKDCSYYGTDIAENLFNNGLCLPSGSNLQNVDRERIALVINNQLNGI
jgi:dTDP-4-amino-4,6-dideoxygalactose transaminase